MFVCGAPSTSRFATVVLWLLAVAACLVTPPPLARAQPPGFFVDPDVYIWPANVTIEFGGTTACVGRGELCTDPLLLVIARFDADMYNIRADGAGDFTLTNARVVGRLVQLTVEPRVFAFNVSMGSLSLDTVGALAATARMDVSIVLQKSAGALWPPNNVSNTLQVQYMPQVELSWSHGLKDNSTTSNIVVTCFATFSTEVVDVALRDYIIVGGIPFNFQALAGARIGRFYSVDVDIGRVQFITIDMKRASRIIYPPNLEPTRLHLIYANAITFQVFGVARTSEGTPQIVEPFIGGETTSLTELEVRIRFGTDVTGFNWTTDAITNGAELIEPQTDLSPTQFMVRLRIGDFEKVELFIPKSAGKMHPPNAASARFRIVYAPAVVLTFSNQLVSGDATALLHLSAFANFNTPVTGVKVTDFVMSGANITNFTALSPTRYQIDMPLENATIVQIVMKERSGAIRPPNALGSTITVEKIPPLQDRAQMVRFKVRLWHDHRLVAPGMPERNLLQTEFIPEVAELLGGVNVSRFSIYETEDPREGQTAVFVTTQLVPHFLRHIKKSPTALAIELRAFMRRAEAGNFDLRGKWLSILDPRYIIFDQFDKCPHGHYGDWVYEAEEPETWPIFCPKIPIPCGNGTLLNPCAPIFTIYSGAFLAALLPLICVCPIPIVVSYVRHHETRVVHLASIAMAMFTLVHVWVMNGWYLWMGFYQQFQFLASCQLIVVAVNFLMWYCNHHLRWFRRSSKDFDGRYTMWRKQFPRTYWITVALSMLHINWLRLMFSDFLDVDEFGVEPHVALRKMLSHIRNMGVVTTVLTDIPPIIMILWTLDRFMPDGQDLVLYFSLLLMLFDLIIMAGLTIWPLLPAVKKMPGHLYRVASSFRFSRKHDLESAKVLPEESPFTRVTFVKGRPMGLPFASTNDPMFPAMIKGTPTDQALEQGLQHGDCLWRINGSAIVPCTFKEAVAALRAPPRPFTADFRPVAAGATRKERRGRLPNEAFAGINDLRFEEELKEVHDQLYAD